MAMKFERKLAAAAAIAAAAECGGAGCVPALKLESAPFKVPAAAIFQPSEREAAAEPLKRRFEQEIDDALDGIAAAENPTVYFKGLPLHVKDMILIKVAEASQDGKTPELFIRMRPKLDEDYAKRAALLFEKNLMIPGPDGTVTGLFDPVGKLETSSPMTPFGVITASSLLGYQIDWQAPPQIVSPFMLAGKTTAGLDMVMIRKGPLSFTSKQVTRQGEYAFTDGQEIYEPTPQGLTVTGPDRVLTLSAEGGVESSISAEGDVRNAAWSVPSYRMSFEARRVRGRLMLAGFSMLDEDAQLFTGGTGYPREAYHTMDGRTAGGVFFGRHGWPIAESFGRGELRIFDESGDVGTYAEEKSKSEDFTRELYVKKLARVLKTQDHWSAFAHAHNGMGGPSEDPFKDNAKSFALFTRDILRIQGVAAAAVRIEGIGTGALWLVNRGAGQVDVFVIGKGHLSKNFEDIRFDRKPYTSLKEAFLDAVKVHAPERLSGADALFDVWRNFDGKIPVLERMEDGSIETKKISINDIIN